MALAAVYNHRVANAAANPLHTAVDLRNHAAGNDPLLFEERHFADVDIGNQCGFVVFIPEEAADIGHEDQAFRADGRRDLCRRRIGIDVVGIALLVCSDRGNDRNISGLERIGDGGNVHRGDFPHQAQIHIPLHFHGAEHAAVQPAEAERTASVHI